MLKEEYREKLYRDYITRVQGTPGIEPKLVEIESRFPIWDAYYQEHLPRDRSAAILDIGCGSGDFIHYLRSSGYRNSSGIDISEEQISTAHRLGIPGVSRGDFRRLLESSPAGYNVVIGQDVIEHFSKEEVLDILNLIYRSLMPGGVCIIKTANAESPFWPRYRFGDFTHESSFTRTSIETVLRLTGFRTVASYPVPPISGYSWRSAIRSILWKGIESVWRICLLIENGDAGGIFTGNLITVAFK
jgi:2-polyprenyl-3-methyl-5-hydroxy-6-metoxy-1,4-benzoquinol methylase